MQIDKVGNRWIARSTYEERAIPKAAGFRWNPQGKYWYTEQATVAERLIHPEQYEAQKAESRATDADIDIPCPDGLSYLPYQRAGIKFALSHNSVLFGDEMGLGKTIQVIGAINADASLQKILIVCPASLKLNWAKELGKWLVRPMSIGIASGDSLPVERDILIVNYDIVSRHAAALRAVRWDLLVADEAHYLKTPTAKRTVAVVGSPARKSSPAVPGIQARRRMLLTGTPIPNRPIEAFPLVNYLDPATFPNFFGYARRYCNACQNRFGWDFSGSSNLPELQERLRASIMVRRLKAEVLTELPAKRRSIIELAPNGATAAVEAENEAYERSEEEIAQLQAEVELAKAEDTGAYDSAVKRLQDRTRAAFAEISHLRHQTAVAKIPALIEHLADSIEEHKVVFFAHHHDVLLAVYEAFKDRAVLVYGGTAIEDRQAAVERFQSDPNCKLFVGGILAAGVGLTLTAAAHVVFGELDWVPGNVTQAEDRCHRIGQKDMVLVEHLVLDGSLDARMAKVLVQKQEVIEQALDREVEQEPAVPSKPHVTVTQKEIEAPALQPEVIEAAHQAMKLLAHLDGDNATWLNGIGFNKVDTLIGHSLAEHGKLSPKQAVIAVKLARKYRRQLPAELVTTLLTNER